MLCHRPERQLAALIGDAGQAAHTAELKIVDENRRDTAFLTVLQNDEFRYAPPPGGAEASVHSGCGASMRRVERLQPACE